MRLARAALTDQHHRFGPRDVPAFGQFADLRRGYLWRSRELELFQRFHPWQFGIVQPVRDGMPVALFTLHRQQRFQITDVAAIFFHRLFRQLYEVRAHHRHFHRLAKLPHRSVLQSLRLLVHGRTASSNWS
jgi:hypothetical protein